jgi:flavin-binding protein dodecin
MGRRKMAMSKMAFVTLDESPYTVERPKMGEAKKVLYIGTHPHSPKRSVVQIIKQAEGTDDHVVLAEITVDTAELMDGTFTVGFVQGHVTDG